MKHKIQTRYEALRDAAQRLKERAKQLAIDADEATLDARPIEVRHLESVRDAAADLEQDLQMWQEA